MLFQRIYYLSISLTGLPCHLEPSIVLMSILKDINVCGASYAATGCRFYWRYPDGAATQREVGESVESHVGVC